MTCELDFLKSVSYFADLETSVLRDISQSFIEKKLEKNNVIAFEDEPVNELYVVRLGALKMYKSSIDGKEQILSILRPGFLFNDVPIFSGETSPVSVGALVPSVVYGISKNNLSRLIDRYPKLNQPIIKTLALRIRELTSLIEDLSFRSVTHRIAKILIEQFPDKSGYPAALTQRDMAAMAGTVREMVGRSLKLLEEKGMIKIDKHRIIISNKQALEDIIRSE